MIKGDSKEIIIGQCAPMASLWGHHDYDYLEHYLDHTEQQ